MRSRVDAVGIVLVVLVLGFFVVSFHEGGINMSEHFPAPDKIPGGNTPAGNREQATFGSGCFWCSEAIFARMKGVEKAVSGYSGGQVENPTYSQVCTGRTGHAEVVQVTFNPNVISYPELLEVFWRSHDPTTRNRQGEDVGPQYRSIILYHSDEQRRQAERYKAAIDASGVFSNPLVTEIVPFVAFYPAEIEHQNFYTDNPRQGYCRVVIQPKLDKLRKVFQDRIKTN
jgi:peptide-methionine (S)-S-oxide reductase